MHPIDILLLILIGAVLVLAVRALRTRRRKGGSCHGCGCDCGGCHRKKEE